MEKLSLLTSDNIKIAANLYAVEKPIGWLVLLHMMPATKESWHDFAIEAQKTGYESIAIDLRGYGKSSGEPDGFLKFSDEEHQKSILDAQAAVEYLIKERKADPKKIAFIGASIGANLSLQYIAENSEFKTAVLLSPGLNYRSIKTEPLVEKLQIGQKIFFISAKDDSVSRNTEQNQKLYNLTPNNINKKIKIYETGGHGTDILKNQPESTNLIIEFLKQ